MLPIERIRAAEGYVELLIQLGREHPCEQVFDRIERAIANLDGAYKRRHYAELLATWRKSLADDDLPLRMGAT